MGAHALDFGHEGLTRTSACDQEALKSLKASPRRSEFAPKGVVCLEVAKLQCNVSGSKTSIFIKTSGSASQQAELKRKYTQYFLICRML